MNILFTRFPLESTFGGAEVQTISLMRGLHERGHAVQFLGSCPTLLSLCQDRGIPAHELKIGPPPVTKAGAVSFAWRRRKMSRRLVEYLAAYQHLDAVVMLSLSEKLLLTAPALERQMRVYWLEHDRVGRWLRRNPWLPQLMGLSKKVMTICVSELSKRVYVDMGWKARQVIAIPNGIDTERLRPSAQPSGPPSDHLKIGCVARLTKDKGVDLLVKGLAKLTHASLEIIGSGREEEHLHMMIYERGMQERVHIGPGTKRMGDFYQSIDFLVLPSREHDPFGLVAAEAMLMGTPVLVTDACGIADYLQDGHDAIVVPAKSSRALLEGMTRLTDAGLRERIGKKGQQTALEQFSLTTMVNRYEQLLLAQA